MWMTQVYVCQGVLAVHFSCVFQFHSAWFSLSFSGTWELQVCHVFLDRRHLSRKQSNTPCRMRCFKQHWWVYTTGGLVSEAAHIFLHIVILKTTHIHSASCTARSSLTLNIACKWRTRNGTSTGILSHLGQCLRSSFCYCLLVLRSLVPWFPKSEKWTAAAATRGRK